MRLHARARVEPEAFPTAGGSEAAVTPITLDERRAAVVFKPKPVQQRPPEKRGAAATPPSLRSHREPDLSRRSCGEVASPTPMQRAATIRRLVCLCPSISCVSELRPYGYVYCMCTQL